MLVCNQLTRRWVTSSARGQYSIRIQPLVPIDQVEEMKPRLRGPAEILWAVTGLYQGKREAERYLSDDLSWGDFMGCTTSKEQTDRYVFGFLFSKVFSSGITANMRIVSAAPRTAE